MSAAPDDFRLAPDRAAELVRVAGLLGISPEELLDRAVRRELARALLDGAYSQADGLDGDAALSLVYSERDAARAGA